MSVKLESSLTDLMTSLAVVFILLMLALVNSMGNAGKNELQNIQELLKVNHNLECTNNERRGDPLSCTITLSPKELHYEEEGVTIGLDGERYLAEVFPKIMDVLTCEGIIKSVEGIYIEGYASPSGTDEVNLWYSQNRSYFIGKSLLSKVFPRVNDSLQRRKLMEWLYLLGRGEQDVVYQKNSDGTPLLDSEGKKLIDENLSRRVEVTIRVKSLQQRAASEKIEGALE